MKKNNLITNILIVLTISFTAVSTLSAQENHIQFSVVNDTARIDSSIPEDSLGSLLGGDDESDLDNVDHGDGMLFTYFTWMPGYSRYQNFDIIRIHYRHTGFPAPSGMAYSPFTNSLSFGTSTTVGVNTAPS